MENHYFESTFSKWTMSLPPTQMIALHDVDLLPTSNNLKYEHFGKFPYHLIPHWMHPQYYNYPKYIGGAMIISRQSFNLVNGFSNRYWGWGREDDEFGVRLKEANLNASLFPRIVRLNCMQVITLSPADTKRSQTIHGSFKVSTSSL